MTLTENLAHQITALAYGDIPSEVVEKLKTCLLYGLSMAAGGANGENTETGLQNVLASPGSARVLLSAESRAPADAAFLNAHLMCARGQNDTFAAAFAHPGCVVIPAVLALAQERRVAGAEVLAALAVGYETLARCASDIAPAAVARHFRASSVFGAIAAAAAASRVIGLNAAQTAHALGLATQFASGTMQCWAEGTPEWRIQIGQTSRSGVFAALLAESGQTAAGRALEGADGFYAAFCGTAFEMPDHWLWATPSVVFKPLPGCLINQPPVYLLMSLMREYGFEGQAVLHVRVELSERNAAYPGIVNYGPFATSAGAIMSCPFMIEILLRSGHITLGDFAEHYGLSPVHAASKRIQVVAASEVVDWGCRLTVTLADGRTLSDEMRDMSRFAFAWDECSRILEHTTREWPMAGATERYRTLSTQVRRLETATRVDHLLEALTMSQSANLGLQGEVKRGQLFCGAEGSPN